MCSTTLTQKFSASVSSHLTQCVRVRSTPSPQPAFAEWQVKHHRERTRKKYKNIKLRIIGSHLNLTYLLTNKR